MNEENRYDLLEHDLRKQPNSNMNDGFEEETAAEIAAPIRLERKREYGGLAGREVEGGRGVGITALVLSIISLFVLPVLFGAAGIIIGFMARRRGAEGLGGWAIGIGAVSIIIGIFIAPFF